MSSPDAIATVTATLQNLLANVAVGASVTTQSPSIARNGETGAQINIFLYSVHHNAAFRNSPMPNEIRSGETALPPLPLVLKYLITAYGLNDDDISGQQLLGQVMSLLHDHPILGKSDIEGITPDSGLHRQIENIRITSDSLSLDDMSKLWTSFQSAEYRLSTGYEVSVVLIRSTRPAKTPLPVLTRGENDSGISAQADLIPPYPTISEVNPPNQQLSVGLGDTVSIDGHHLDGDSRVMNLTNSDLPAPITLPIGAGTANHLSAQIPNDPSNWVAGVYMVDVTISKAGEPDKTSNALPLPITPRIIDISPASPVPRDGSGNVTLTITCSPEIRPEQRVALLLGDREVLSQTRAVQTDTLSFLIEEALAGSRFVRLRVDGIDSPLIDHSVTPPVFDPAMEVTIS